jgi:hypothetical protein
VKREVEQIRNLGFILSALLVFICHELGTQNEERISSSEKENKLVYIFRGDLWSSMKTLEESFGHVVKFIFYF